MTGGDRTYRENKHRDIDETAIHPTIINYGSKKIEIETATFAAKIDRNRSFLQNSQSTQHYILPTCIASCHPLIPSGGLATLRAPGFTIKFYVCRFEGTQEHN